ncbi:hypothetical protein EPUS_06969 [Endocarpon pusillum Z07020]|uniref:VIT domain-containing protein n=1 Tax=Endocarpon pusillum (strain Z07020 / HMAS-L-300199) TaxID=1263415 RepID=U1GWE0_ENDPU|nr:uncharacterized protein EPUS_06969 [Endocarpon pusillum Z07020]ERF76411.1 hypothetical protein EPUS_06969 [Endocarpon pusillum Z07020]
MDCLPLLEVSLDVKVSAAISRTLLTQSFMNYSNIPIKQANYSFPLYDGSIVVAFRCYIGEDTVLVGKIKSKEEAETEFCEAVRRRRATALLQEHTPETFEINLGLIPAQTKVKAEVTYINELKADLGGDGVLVTIPTSVAARYGSPPEGYDGKPVTNASVRTTESGLRIQVEVYAPVPIRKLECRTHPISVELGAEGHATPADSFGDLSPGSNVRGFNPNKARATLTDQNASLSRDFVLLILTSSPGPFPSRAFVEPHPDRPHRLAMMVTINPYDFFAAHLSSTAFKREIIFLADRSGSMTNKIGALKIAMRVFLKSLPQDCHFNICSFGSTWSSLWPCSREYSHETLDLAERHIAMSFESNMGGTELLPALQGIVRECMTLGNRNTEIIVLTDGEVWETEETIDFVRSTRTHSSDKVRFFALGIGDTVSHRLVEGIGRQGGGFAEVVAVDAAARWESRVIRMLKGALTPPRWQCKVRSKDTFGNFTPLGAGEAATRRDAEGITEAGIQQPDCVQAPFRIPSLHAFSRYSVYFLLDEQTMSDLSNINVLGITSTGEEISVDVQVERVASATTIHSLAAKALMNDLETGQSWLHAKDLGTFNNIHPDEVEEIVRHQAETYGKEWGITGKWTSFVAVHSSTEIEMASRVYRAEPSELSDLTRQRYQSGYGARSYPSPATLGGPYSSSTVAAQQLRRTIVPREYHRAGYAPSDRVRFSPRSSTQYDIMTGSSVKESAMKESAMKESAMKESPRKESPMKESPMKESPMKPCEAGKSKSLETLWRRPERTLKGLSTENASLIDPPSSHHFDSGSSSARFRIEEGPPSPSEWVGNLETVLEPPSLDVQSWDYASQKVSHSNSSEITALLPDILPSCVCTEREKLARESTAPHEMSQGSEAVVRDDPMPTDHYSSRQDDTTAFMSPSRTFQNHMDEDFESPKQGTARGFDVSLSPRSTSSFFMNLIDLQSHEGFFDLQETVRETVLSNFSSHLLERMQQLFTGESSEKITQIQPLSLKRTSELLCETIITIFYVEHQYASLSGLWELVIRKARDWVRKEVESDALRDALADMVRMYWQQSDDSFISKIPDTHLPSSRDNVGKRKVTASMSGAWKRLRSHIKKENLQTKLSG